MTALTFTTYWPLLLVLMVPFLWWMRRFTVAGLSTKHLGLSTIVRSGMVVLLVLAMMQPVLRWPDSAVSVVYLLDVSQSVAPSAVQEAIQWIQRTNDAGNPTRAQFIAFASNSRSFERMEDLTQVAVSKQASDNAIDQSQTDIAAAFWKAMGSFAPENIKRLVLVSDGNENHGDIAAVIPRLKQENIRVFTTPLPVRSGGDVWIESLLAPPQVNAEEQFPLEVLVFSTTEVKSTIEIRNGEKQLTERSVLLKEGPNRVAFETHIEENNGTVVLEAVAHTDGDPFSDNNLFRRPLIVTGRPRILYVEGHAASARFLEEALTTEGFSVDIGDPMALPETAEEFARYDAVILSDVDAKTMPGPQMEALSTYVRELGGGLVLAGGENVYGEGGYSKTPIEDMLPVTFDVKKPLKTVMMIVVLDKSGSMAGDKIRYAKEATKAPVALLKETDHFGVATFNYNTAWPVQPQLVTDRDAIINTIDNIGVGGETNLFPAMTEAYGELEKATDEIKHVIILSDGRTLTGDFEGLTKKMAEAKITLSTVSVGQEADRDLMGKIAEWGNGKAYYADDPAHIPQIFNEDVESSAGEALEETEFKLIVVKNVDAFKGIDLSSAPSLLGYVQVKARPEAEVLLDAQKDRPLMARWQFGLGKTVVFTSDLKDRWAAQWLEWKEYSKFWSQTVRETMRRQNDSDFDVHVERADGFAVISVDATGNDGQHRDRLRMQVHVVAPDQSTAVFEVPQIGPGTYETRVPLKQKGTYMFRTADAGGESSAGATHVLAYSYPEEYHFYPPDLEKLKTISKETGGTFQPQGPEIFDTAGEHGYVSFALWPWLTAVGLGLYVVDVFLRRLRLYEDAPTPG